jgi:hypothetical protein
MIGLLRGLLLSAPSGLVQQAVELESLPASLLSLRLIARRFNTGVRLLQPK